MAVSDNPTPAIVIDQSFYFANYLARLGGTIVSGRLDHLVLTKDAPGLERFITLDTGYKVRAVQYHTSMKALLGASYGDLQPRNTIDLIVYYSARGGVRTLIKARQS